MRHETDPDPFNNIGNLELRRLSCDLMCDVRSIRRAGPRSSPGSHGVTGGGGGSACVAAFFACWRFNRSSIPLRDAILAALKDYPEALAAVVAALEDV